MPYNALLADLQAQKFKPLYALLGEEAFFIDQMSHYFQHEVLSEEEKAFNLHILFGKDSTVEQILQLARSFPMVGNRQLILVKEAQDLKNLENFIPYLENPQSSSLIVLCHKYKTIAKNTKIAKAIMDKGVYFETPKITDAKLGDWIENQAKKHDLRFAPNALLLFKEHVGGDLGKIDKILERLAVLLPKGAMISPEDVQKHVGISKEYNLFEWQKALAQKDLIKAQQIALHFGKQDKDFPLPMLLGFLYGFFAKLVIYHYNKQKAQTELCAMMKIAPFQIRDYQIASGQYNPKQAVEAIAILRKYDLKSKGVNNQSASWDELLLEMTQRLIFA
jgi:DNA polymerase-3 subunit delta